jgi:hypothetical protein
MVRLYLSTWLVVKGSMVIVIVLIGGRKAKILIRVFRVWGIVFRS